MVLNRLSQPPPGGLFRTRRSASSILLVSREDDDIYPGPFFYQPDPGKLLFVQPKGEKLVRRGRSEFFLVGKTPDGRQVETRLTAGRFN